LRQADAPAFLFCRFTIYIHEKFFMASYVIGVDIGTGSTKALAVNHQGKVVCSAQVHYPTLNPKSGYCEQAPELVWQAFAKCIHRVVTEAKETPDAIILSSAMHSTIPVDVNGTPLHDMIIWADNRSASVARKIKDSSSGEELYKETGTPIHAMSPLCKITWIKENDPELFKKTFKFISIKEFIWFKLFRTYEVDHSIASATGLMDIHTCEWSSLALQTCGIAPDRLSKLVSPDFTRTGIEEEACEFLNIPRSTPCIMGASDGCLANLGSFATSYGIAALTIGTSGAVRVASASPAYNFSAMTFNYRLDEKTFISGGPSNNGGVALRWYAETFLQKTLNTAADYENILSTLTLTSPGSEGLIFVPYLFGERAPIWDSNASGVFFGIRSSHTQAHFTRAVIEGISMALYDIADNMIQGGLAISQINVSGGFVKSAAWLQILANIFNKKICLINSDDASAIGAAYLGLKSLGIIKYYDLLQPETVKEILPQEQFINIYQSNFKTYRSIYQSLKV
jgi:gluconokinase